MANKRIFDRRRLWPAGAACAARLRRLDEKAEIFVFERGPDISFANCGLPYYLGGVIAQRQRLLVATAVRFRDWFNVEIRVRHEVRRIDRAKRSIDVHNLQSGKTTVEPYDALVLAPRRPTRSVRNGPASICRASSPCETWKTPIRFTLGSNSGVRPGPWSSGGGYIGLEMVENLHRRGIEVTVLEAADQVMAPMDAEMVAPVHAELRRQGIDLRLGNMVAGFEMGSDERLRIITSKGDRVVAAVVILAIGVRPSVSLAREAGLEIGSLGGIRVDPQMRTSDPAIWAVGDAVEVRDVVTGQWSLIPLAGPAARQARVAADVICGRNATFRGTQGTAVSSASSISRWR